MWATPVQHLPPDSHRIWNAIIARDPDSQLRPFTASLVEFRNYHSCKTGRGQHRLFLLHPRLFPQQLRLQTNFRLLDSSPAEQYDNQVCPGQAPAWRIVLPEIADSHHVRHCTRQNSQWNSRHCVRWVCLDGAAAQNFGNRRGAEPSTKLSRRVDAHPQWNHAPD